MFDDLKGDNKPAAIASVASGQPSVSTPVKPATNPADDIFGNVDPAPKINPTVFGQDRPSAVQLGKIKPVSQTSAPQVRPPVSTPPPIATPRDQLMMEEDNIGGPKKFIIAGAVVLLILVVAGIVYFFVKRGNNTNQPAPELNQNTNLNVNTNQPPVNMDNTNEEAVINEADDDFDGLPTAEEINLGTNPYEPDSDNDGVFDQDEVQIYKTNPLRDDSDQDELSDYQEIFMWHSDPSKPDTDGDSFNDGVEVKNGYNPLGRGLIEDAPAGTFNLEANINTNQATSTNQNTNQ